MDLNWIKLQGYKRLESTTLKTPGKVVAIIGPNEAGKSSILTALEHLHRRDGFHPSELTRGKDFKDDDVILEAGFLLNRDERSEISRLYKGSEVRQFIVSKLVNGGKRYKALPEVQHNLSPSGTLNESKLVIADHTELDKKIEEILIPRIPKILLFNTDQRDLRSTYDLPQAAKLTPPALRNIASLANLDLTELYKFAANSEQANVRTLLNKANSQIANVVKGKWSQSGVRVRLDSNQNTLYVLVENEQQDCTNLHDRSDGLRQFVALINFLEAKHIDSEAILLIDEAETHLHYDAQADLINIFSKQTLASKVIYTTHSVGCLPEDLGTGVRYVMAVKNTEKSEIENCFWKTNRPGFSPLLFGIGASNLAFIPIRKAVFVEGATDMLLLPTIFRQVINRDYLGFQVAPGLSAASKSDLSLLENEAPKVAFLTDNDAAGKELAKQLQEAGIEDSRIFQLPGEMGMVLEDFFKKELYVEAINNELQTWNKDSPSLSLEDLPDINRPRKLEEWGKAKNVKVPDKKVIAYRLLDFANGERQDFLVQQNFEQPLRELYEKIAKQLDITTAVSS